MYSLDSKKLVMSFDDAGVRTNYSLSLKGRKRLLLISQQPSSSAVADDTQSVSVYSSDISVSGESYNEMLRQAAEARRQAAEARVRPPRRAKRPVNCAVSGRLKRVCRSSVAIMPSL